MAYETKPARGIAQSFTQAYYNKRTNVNYLNFDLKQCFLFTKTK